MREPKQNSLGLPENAKSGKGQNAQGTYENSERKQTRRNNVFSKKMCYIPVVKVNCSVHLYFKEIKEKLASKM